MTACVAVPNCQRRLAAKLKFELYSGALSGVAFLGILCYNSQNCMQKTPMEGFYESR